MLPVVVQDETTGRVLMQAWMNPDALAATQASGKVTFFSRSKNRLWTKGETSGNFLYVKKILTDCDRDSLLVMADPVGPACHLGTESCFNPPPFLEYLENLLKGRMTADPEKSYTARLFAGGPKRIAKKLGEEAVELALEAENGTQDRFIEETADLIYHLSVLMISRGISWKQITEALEKRHRP